MALAITVPALVVLYQQGVASLQATYAAVSYREAVSRAQSRLDGLGATPLAPNEREGDDSSGYHWRTRVAAVATAKPSNPSLQEPSSGGGVTLFAVTVEVSWPGLGGQRRVVLDTRRLGPASAAPP